jgi:hypothetical protein
MPGRFDPYHLWLGVPPDEQPPNHYRLLGLTLFEDNPEVIRDAATQRIAHVRTYQLGPHADVSQCILNDLASAKVCLSDPVKKAAYDAGLRNKLGKPTQSEYVNVAEIVSAVRPVPAAIPRRQKVPWLIASLVAAGAVPVVAGFLVYLSSGKPVEVVTVLPAKEAHDESPHKTAPAPAKAEPAKPVEMTPAKDVAQNQQPDAAPKKVEPSLKISRTDAGVEQPLASHDPDMSQPTKKVHDTKGSSRPSPAGPAYPVSVNMRKWTHNNGTTFDGEFIKAEKRDDGANIITLRKPDGSEMTVRAMALSQGDRKYTIQIMKSRKSEDDVKFLRRRAESRHKAHSTGK